MSQLGHSRSSWAVHAASAFHPLATTERTSLNVTRGDLFAAANSNFLRARGGAFDVVLTRYHDQIAMKLMGFDRGVTILGGFPFPICTPAHGTAYDIAGQGIASVGASRAALLLAAEMAAAARIGHRAA
jgi:4-hydroxy-L-threonine phosphate dehydrogenase PdxA